MDSIAQQVVAHLKEARNILVTVRNDPTVDLLSACIGLTLALDKMDKHVAAVFSGAIPSTIEFLKPQETLEPSPDSLRDFIIALDKAKADKLRYKVEDKVVRIFITPYKTSLSQADLEFSQGDFNVDAVVALGAHEQKELDQAITTHGRILHDATVISVNNVSNGNLGSINWLDTNASSISELVTQLVKDLDQNILDEQISTALLTGIVAETDRFSNEKTSPKTMSLAGDLMSAGANQQLVATHLEAPVNDQVFDRSDNANTSSSQPLDSESISQKLSINDDGTLEIEHQPDFDDQRPLTHLPSSGLQDTSVGFLKNRPMMPLPEPPITDSNPNPNMSLDQPDQVDDNNEEPSSTGRSFLIDDPVVPGATSLPPNRVEPSSVNPFDVPAAEAPAPLIPRENSVSALDSSPTEKIIMPPPVQENQISSAAVPDNNETLEEIEESVDSPHLHQPSKSSDLDAARHQVLEALQDSPAPPPPIISLNASPLGSELHPEISSSSVPADPSVVDIDKEGNLKPGLLSQPPQASKDLSPLDRDSEVSQAMDMPLPSIAPNRQYGSTESNNSLPPNSPPPVPPPFMPNNF